MVVRLILADFRGQVVRGAYKVFEIVRLEGIEGVAAYAIDSVSHKSMRKANGNSIRDKNKPYQPVTRRINVNPVTITFHHIGQIAWSACVLRVSLQCNWVHVQGSIQKYFDWVRRAPFKRLIFWLTDPFLGEYINIYTPDIRYIIHIYTHMYMYMIHHMYMYLSVCLSVCLSLSLSLSRYRERER